MCTIQPSEGKAQSTVQCVLVCSSHRQTRDATRHATRCFRGKVTSSRLPREKIFPEFNAYIYFISQVICYFSPLRVSQVEERQTNVDVRLPVRYLPTFTRTLFVYHIRPPHKVCFPTVQVFQSNIKDVTKKIRIVLALRLGLHRKCTKPNFCTLSTFAHFIPLSEKPVFSHT